MANYKDYSVQELLEMRSIAEEEFKQCQDIIREAYETLKQRSDEYQEITNELDSRNNG